MGKYTFLGNENVIRGFVLVAICLTYSLSHAIIIFIALSLFCYLFRKKQIDFSEFRTVDNNLSYSISSGWVENVECSNEGTKIVVKSRIKDTYGVYLPFDCHVLKSQSRRVAKDFLGGIRLKVYIHNLELETESGESLKLSIRSLLGIFKPRIWLKPGDIGKCGANIGFVPFGSKIEVKTPKGVKVLVKKRDIVASLQTLLISYNKE